MFHKFYHSISNIEQPKRFTYPFCYTPHQLCLVAAGELQEYLAANFDFDAEGCKGKMFGVLVVRDEASGGLGYLAAFSGLLNGHSVHPFFVPPVYDLTVPDGYFRTEEQRISSINADVETLMKSDEYVSAREHLIGLKSGAEEELDAMRRAMKQAKEERDRKRDSGMLTDEERNAMIKESQYMKAELKRRERHWAALIDDAAAVVSALDAKVNAMKEERKHRSALLQDWLFTQFDMLNARGERKALPEIFADTPQGTPPAGAGECAAPRLLQYAYLHHLHPVAMAEFWWGRSPKNEVRVHGEYYPACQGKCGPILRHMLQGLDVDPNPMESSPFGVDYKLEILYEDKWVMVVNKPAGMLSAPGKNGGVSVYDIIRHRYPDATGPLIVHRLDMATSGVLLIAKTKEVHKALQQQFEQRTVKKRYVAILEAKESKPGVDGMISLPISPDYMNRPCQKVDVENGKEAVTIYRIAGEVVHRDGKREVRVHFTPLTGRTHQLRVHSAHPEGLNSPIKGDALYGRSADRLYLHAESVTFAHPADGRVVTVERRADF